jgi:hypothetical protein
LAEVTLNTLQAGQAGLQTQSAASEGPHPTASQCTRSKIASKHSTASSISPTYPPGTKSELRD